MLVRNLNKKLRSGVKPHVFYLFCFALGAGRHGSISKF